MKNKTEKVNIIKHNHHLSEELFKGEAKKQQMGGSQEFEDLPQLNTLFLDRKISAESPFRPYNIFGEQNESTAKKKISDSIQE